MLDNKSLTQIVKESLENTDIIEDFFCGNEVFSLLEEVGGDLSKKYGEMLAYDVQRGFTQISIYYDSIKGFDPTNFSKSSYYRFRSDPDVDWCELEIKSAIEQIKQINESKRADSKQKKLYGQGMLVMDDTTFERPRSEKTELVTTQYDHCSHTYYQGYRLLVMLWTNGETSIPVCAILVSTSTPEKDKVEPKEAKEASAKEFYTEQAQKEMPEIVYLLLERLVKLGLPFDFVSADSWFTSKRLIKETVDLGKNYIGRVKDGNTHYRIRYKGETLELTAKEILELKGGVPEHKEDAKGSFRITKIQIPYEEVLKKGRRGVKGSAKKKNSLIDGLLAYCYNDSSDDKNSYYIIITTLLELKKKGKKLVQLYATRWMIEVLFWTLKLYLGLTETKLLSLEGQNEHLCSVFLRYRLLAYLTSKEENDYTLMEQLFVLCREYTGSYWHDLFIELSANFCQKLISYGVPEAVIKKAWLESCQEIDIEMKVSLIKKTDRLTQEVQSEQS